MICLSQPIAIFGLHACCRAKVLAIIARPPGGTWSAARFRDDGGSRPLRGELWPWGLPLLSLREREQVLTANTLMAVTFRFAYAAQASGTAMVVEHPAYPSWIAERRPPCIWRLPLCQALLQQPGVDLHTVDQCMLGAAGRKPTSLLSVHVPDLGRLIGAAPFRCRCSGDHEHSSLQGKTDAMEGRAASHKQYPRGLSELLAGAILAQSRLRESCGARFHDVWAAIDEEVASCYAALDYTLELAGEAGWGR